MKPTLLTEAIKSHIVIHIRLRSEIQMALNNPFAGGPDYVVALRNALEAIPNAYVRPPAAGGEQISIRFPDSRLAMVKAIEERCKHARWNRSQVINTLFERGLFELFRQLGDQTVEGIMDDVASETVPTLNRFAGIADQLKEFNRFRIYPAVQKRHSNGLYSEIEITWHDLRLNERSDRIDLSGEQWGLQLPVSRLKGIIPDTVRDAKDFFKNAILELDLQVILQGKDFELVPLRPTYLERKRKR